MNGMTRSTIDRTAPSRSLLFPHTSAAVQGSPVTVRPIRGDMGQALT